MSTATWTPGVKREWLAAANAGEQTSVIAERYGAPHNTVRAAISRLRARATDQAKLAARRKRRNSMQAEDLAFTCVDVFGRAAACRALGIGQCHTRDVARMADEQQLARLHVLARCVLLDVRPDDVRSALALARDHSRDRLDEIADQGASL